MVARFSRPDEFHNADYEFPETLSNPTPAQSKMTAALGPLPLGGTPDGKAWCLKALHPADHTVTKARYPGGSKHPTVSAYYTQVIELKPDALVGGAHTTSWEAEMFLRQDPVAPVSFNVVTSADGNTSVHSFPWINRTVTQWSPIQAGVYGRCPIPTLRAAYDAFAADKNFYRITHLGATVEHVCSATTNQGTIISGQYAVEPTTASIAGYPLTLKQDGMTFVGVEDANQTHFPLQGVGVRNGETMQTMFEAPLCRTWREGPYSQEMLLQGTNGYTGPAREGLYVPLKLANPGKLVNLDHKYVLNGYNGLGSAISTIYKEHVTKAYSEGSVNTGGWPYFATLEKAAGQAADILVGFKEAGPSVSHTVISGLDPHATLRIYLRVGYEYVPEIQSDTACFAQMSPLPDELAVRMYQEICVRLKDAYPMDYNDKSTLLTVLSRIAQRLVPAIDAGLDFFSKVPGNPWSVPAQGLRLLTQAYMKPKAAKSGPTPRKKKKGPSMPPRPKRIGVADLTMLDPAIVKAIIKK